jgi:hypothetical protein
LSASWRALIRAKCSIAAAAHARLRNGNLGRVRKFIVFDVINDLLALTIRSSLLDLMTTDEPRMNGSPPKS